MRSLRRRLGRVLPTSRTQDEGAILIVAILIITVVALVTGALLTRGDGSLRATVALREVAGSTYAADGAAQVALNDLRTGFWDGDAVKPTGWTFTNEPGEGCFGRNATDIVTENKDLLLSNFYPASKASGDGPSSAYIECVPETATGAQGTARLVTNANSPGDAIIILGNGGGEDGINTFNKRLSVRGGIRVNSNINANGEGIRVNDANVRVKGACSGTILVSVGFTKVCNSSGVSDPNYAADITSIPALQVPPTSCGALSYIALEPGYYDDAAALENLNGCNGKTLWFKPGTYYFDFHNKSGIGDPLFQTGVSGSDNDNEWSISDRKVIGGTPIDGAGNVLAAPPANPTIGKSCQNPIDTANANGVQFIFGGDSRIYINSDAKTELCATYRSNRPPMVVYQNKSGNNPSLTTLTAGTALTTNANATVTAAGTDGTFVGGTQAALQDTAGGTAVWQRTAAGGTATRTLTMTGFQPTTNLPKGAVLKDARLIVRHRNTGTAATAATVKITPTAPGATALLPYTLTRPATLFNDSVNLRTQLPAAQWALFAKGVHDFGYQGATIDYAATLPSGVTRVAEVDSVRLELEYYVPQMRGPGAISTNCVTTIGGCYLINTHKKSELYLQGTTYIPQGKAYLEVANTDFQVFRWGIIARSLYTNLNGAYKEDGALIELPDNSPGLGLNGILVQIKVWVCPNSPTCSNAGKEALNVRAQIYDKDGIASTPDREVTVLNWSHTR